MPSSRSRKGEAMHVATEFRVTATALNLRSSPAKASLALAVLRRGQTVRSLAPPQEADPGWLYIDTGRGRGWAASTYLAPVVDGAGSTAAVDVHRRQTELAHLHPACRAAVEAVLSQLEQESLPFRVYEAFRAPERQRHLHAQGRTMPGPRVTNAQPWESYHQFGLAVDLVLFENGRWSWDTGNGRRTQWQWMNQIGRAHGLEPLSWELPHLQLAGLRVADLRRGELPAGGDDSWLVNLEAAILRWDGTPAAPPPPATRPPLTS